jgi:hypothetical protein
MVKASPKLIFDISWVAFLCPSLTKAGSVRMRHTNELQTERINNFYRFGAQADYSG